MSDDQQADGVTFEDVVDAYHAIRVEDRRRASWEIGAFTYVELVECGLAKRSRLLLGLPIAFSTDPDAFTLAKRSDV